MRKYVVNAAYHEGSVLFIQGQARRVELANDVDLTEACEIASTEYKIEHVRSFSGLRRQYRKV
jgi:hypothetical protein